MLAVVSDNAVVGMWIVQLVVSIAMAVGMFVLTMRTRRFETMETNLAATAKKLVTNEIALQTQPLQSAIDRLTNEMSQVRQRLTDGDGTIAELGEANTGIKLALQNQTGELQKWMLEKFASKNDLGLIGNRLDSLGDRVGQMAQAQARAEGYAEGAGRKPHTKA